MTLVPVDTDGLHDLAAFAEAVSKRTMLVTVMAANNETGVLAPLFDITETGTHAGTYAHRATQLMAWAASTPQKSLSIPQGVGALYV